MTNKQLKDNLGKFLEITWVDPRSEIRTNLEDFLKRGFAVVVTNGYLAYVEGDMVVLEHEKIEGDEDRDLTLIHRDLIKTVKVIL